MKKGVGTLKSAGERLAERIATVADESQAKDVLILDLLKCSKIQNHKIVYPHIQCFSHRLFR